MNRRLAAILAADVVGYSRLIRIDEERTLLRLKAIRTELIEPAVAKHNGRIFKVMGDGGLAEFASVINAVSCAVDIQKAMNDGLVESADEQPIQLRIGINFGDVVVDGGDIYGDGVNVAARLESLADPGGICISGKVYGEVAGRLDLVYQDLGWKDVKNIDGGVHAYRILPAGQGERAPAGPQSCMSLNYIPSIAVLPFANMSGDSAQEHFADGVSEELITELARFRDLFVVARNSSFTFKGKHAKVQDIGRELGVSYVVEGSVRIVGNRLRVTAQLIETESGGHIWADRYDLELEDILTVQAEIAQIIAGVISPEIGRAEQKRARRRPAQHLNAWESYQRGLWHLNRFTHPDLLEAKRSFEVAISCDPDFAAAHSGLAYALVQEVMYSEPADTGQLVQLALDSARKGVELDSYDAFAHYVLGRAYILRRELDIACGEFQKAIELNPSFAYAYYGLGVALLDLSRFEEALENFRYAERLSPRDPHAWAFIHYQAWPLFAWERYEEVVDLERQALRNPNAGFWPYLVLIAALGHLGWKDEAAKELERLQFIQPGYACDKARRHLDDAMSPLTDRVIDGLRKAGLPVTSTFETPNALEEVPSMPAGGGPPEGAVAFQTAEERPDAAGLRWPKDYAKLKARLRKEWQVEGEIYLHRRLSGKSGAAVYAVDITSRGFSGQAILKLDEQRDPAWSEEEESERHRQAMESEPEYAAQHLPSIVHTCQHEGRIAILSTIAGGGLEYARPWARCPYVQALNCVDRLSRELLEDWNEGYQFADGMLQPAELLEGWLGYRLDPAQGRIHGFLKDECGLDPSSPAFIFEGHWYPNPLAFAKPTNQAGEGMLLRAATGHVHGDLHGFNLLVEAEGTADPGYHLIDLALYVDRQYLFYDHAYLELSYLLRSREDVHFARFKEILDAMAAPGRAVIANAPSGDDVGLIRMIEILRRGERNWVERHEPNRLSYLTCQRMLARVAVGLNFTNKPLPRGARLMALLHSAHNLKHYLKFQSIDWSRDGQPLTAIRG